MSDHSDLKHFLKSLDKMLDSISVYVHTMRCKIRVEQELDIHAVDSQEEFSGSSETNALPFEAGQGGPELFPGTSKERSRSQKAAEKVLTAGGRMESDHGGT